MTLGSWLAQSTALLRGAEVESARLDCLIIAEGVLRKDRAWILAHYDFEIYEDALEQLDVCVSRRKKHVQVAYIIGKAHFFGREFAVCPDVLVPRPDSEAMLDLLLKIVKTEYKNHNPAIVDIGTGSGCLGITAALELQEASVELRDVDDKALAQAKINAKALNANVTFAHANLLNPAPNCDIILANLPYVPENFPINKAARHEPAIALFSGENGLDLYSQMWEQIGNLTHQPQYVITESLLHQHNYLVEMSKNAGYSLIETSGLAQCFRLNLICGS